MDANTIAQMMLDELGYTYDGPHAEILADVIVSGCVSADLRGDRRSLLSYMTATRQWEAVKWLLEHGADANAETANRSQVCERPSIHYTGPDTYFSDADEIVGAYAGVKPADEPVYRAIIDHLMRCNAGAVGVVPEDPPKGDRRLRNLFGFIVSQYDNYVTREARIQAAL